MPTDTRAVVQRDWIEQALALADAYVVAATGDTATQRHKNSAARNNLRAFLAALPEQPAAVQEFWLVLDETGNPMHPATNPDAAHQFVKDMQNEFLDEPAHLAAISQWTVVKVVVS